MRPPVTDLGARFASLAVPDLQRVELVHQFPRRTGKVADVFAVERRLEHLPGVGTLVDGQPGILVECGFGVERFEMAGATDHEQPDHALGLGGQAGQA